MDTCNKGVVQSRAPDLTTISLSSKSLMYLLCTVEDDVIGGPYNVRVYILYYDGGTRLLHYQRS